MTFQRINFVGLFILIFLALGGCTPPNNVALGPNVDPLPRSVDRLEVEAAREGVFLLKEGQREALPISPERVILETGEGLAVDTDGRAVLYFNNWLTAELFQEAELLRAQQELTLDQVAVTLFQNGGTLIVRLNQPEESVPHRLTIQTAFARIEASGNSHFAIVREPSSPQEWVVALETGEAASLQITANEITEPIGGGQARWVTSVDGPGPAITLPPEANTWLEGTRSGALQPSLGQTLWPPADILTNTDPLVTLPDPDQPFELGRSGESLVTLSLDGQGLFGNPRYSLEDCNGDGLRDIALQKGILKFDFRQVLGQVTAVDVTLLNRSAPNNGALQGLDPAGARIGWLPLEAGVGEIQTLSLRSAMPYHYAELRLLDACFLGFSLTPPKSSGEPGEPRTLLAPTEQLPSSDQVVNVLQSSAVAQRLPQNGQLQAPGIGTGSLAGLIRIDGQEGDWTTLSGRSGVNPSRFSAVTYDEACANRYPNAGSRTDLAGQVQLAYDEQYLHVAFWVEDDGLLPYSGSDERFFLGDSPQLLLDLDLNTDFDDPELSADDIQIDLRPALGQAQAMLWQLSTLRARPIAGASVAVVPTTNGYFMEATLPWQELGFVPRPGDQLGIVASISDNDTPDTNAQECIISTSPQRDWRNPTTWGTVFLRPAGQ